MRIAICTAEGRADDILTWSGIPANVVRTMRDLDADCVVLDEPSPLLVRSGKVVAAASKRARLKVNWEVEPWLVRRMTREMQAQARRANADVLLLLGWHTLGVEDGDIPAVIWTDATYAQRMDKAPHWQRLSERTRRQVEPIEGTSLREMAAVIMSSTVAYEDALSRYRLTPSRVHRIGFGANRVGAEAQPKLRIGALPRLLAVGVEWERKGMDRCVLIADELRRRGVPVHLDVVGVRPPDSSWQRDHVTYHGFLNKDSAEDSAKLDSLYRAADLFVLPTRNEPFGIVFAEAAAYALPSLGSAVDGVPDVVRQGHSGILLPVDASAAQYADEVANLLAFSDRYAGLSHGAVTHFRTSLTWDSAVRSVHEVCEIAAKQQ
ncbi:MULTISPECIES: glycosyltransferase family 4 protein [Micromonospora]|uniref:glycosyltransferase family 4 protein n=1 Tax=Micromonospora TaxID=1873 RepID=UPI001EE99687|nr:glycosyltransferase family 4 protein [Micromonospora hortensis]MCG5448747.1 glycosyltransferase family 4 protein [Micromonospora hortensis]WTI09359.1 glycosyltransferase family 4 protein [Micromonospora sp. NBC_00821]